MSRYLAELYLRPDPLTEEELALVAKLVEEAGGRDWAHDEADRQIDAALTSLSDADPAPRVRHVIADLAHLVTHRDH